MYSFPRITDENCCSVSLVKKKEMLIEHKFTCNFFATTNSNFEKNQLFETCVIVKHICRGKWGNVKQNFLNVSQSVYIANMVIFMY